MAYKPTTWNTGDVITADKLNNIESGVTNADSKDAKVTAQLQQKAGLMYVDEEIAKAQLVGAGVDTSAFVLRSEMETVNNRVGRLNHANVLVDPTMSDNAQWLNGSKVYVENSESFGRRVNNVGGSVTINLNHIIMFEDISNGNYFFSIRRKGNNGTSSIGKFSVMVGLISSTTGLFGGYANIVNDPSNTTETVMDRSFTLDKNSLLASYPKATCINISFSTPAGTDQTFYEPILAFANTVDKRYFVQGTLLKKVKEAMSGNLAGKSMYYDGDSIAYGAGSNGKGFGDILAERYGLVLTKKATSGATLAVFQPETRHNIVTSVLNNFNEPFDYALLEGGYNDLGNKLSLGTLSTNLDIPYTENPDTTTVIGALEKIFQHIQKNYPKTKIYFLLTHKTHNYFTKPLSVSNLTQTDVYNAIRSVCERYSVEIIDIFNKSGFNTYFAEHKAFTQNGDGIHPSLDGYEIFYMPVIERQMK